MQSAGLTALVYHYILLLEVQHKFNTCQVHFYDLPLKIITYNILLLKFVYNN